MRAKPFSRPTLIAAVELLEGHSQARFNQMVLRLGLEDEIGSGTAVSVAKTCDILGRVVLIPARAVSLWNDKGVARMGHPFSRVSSRG
jgi:hypothetical protein